MYFGITIIIIINNIIAIKIYFKQVRVKYLAYKLLSVNKINCSPENGTPITMGMACEHCTKPHVLAKFLARTLS